MLPPAHLCVSCKGSRLLCGQSKCPILEKMNAQRAVYAKIKNELFGPSPPNIFVGHTGYPYVSIGAMASEADVVDDPQAMYGMSLPEIIKQRSQLFRSAVKREVFAKDKYVRDMQEVVLSQKPVDVELVFKSIPKRDVTFSPLTQPMGPLGIIENYSIVGNARIPKKIESIKEEDVRTVDAVKELMHKKYDNYYLTRVLSAGVFGRHKDRRLVPTRWSITATDDMLSKIHIDAIKSSKEICEYELYYNEYLNNRYIVLLIPGRWEFENFEAWAKGSLWNLSDPNMGGAYVTVEHEPFYGRSSYAKLQGGGYYASRFAVTEHLFNRGKQARVVVIREIDPGYMVPVGVWQVRENVRNAFKNRATRFSTLADMLDYAKILLKNPIREYISRDRILRQSTLSQFF